jgi:hypothetical protein
LAEGLKEAVEEDLRLSFFIPGDVRVAPGGEISEFFPARHGRVLREKDQLGKEKAEMAERQMG